MTPPVDALMRHRPAAGSKAAHTSGVLQDWQRCALVDALAGRLIVLCFGSGVDSTAMIVALRGPACGRTSSRSPTRAAKTRDAATRHAHE